MPPESTEFEQKEQKFHTDYKCQSAQNSGVASEYLLYTTCIISIIIFVGVYLCRLALGGQAVKKLCLLASKFELDQSQCKSSQVYASQRKWVAKQNTNWTQVQNLCQLLFGQGFITFRKCMLFLCFSTRENRMVMALPSLRKFLRTIQKQCVNSGQIDVISMEFFGLNSWCFSLGPQGAPDMRRLYSRARCSLTKHGFVFVDITCLFVFDRGRAYPHQDHCDKQDRQTSFVHQKEEHMYWLQSSAGWWRWQPEIYCFFTQSGLFKLWLAHEWSL